MDMKWLAVVFVFSMAFAETIIDSDLGYIDVDGVLLEGEHYTLEGTTLEITAASLKNFTVKNYSVSVTPRNLERIATDMGIPMSDELNQFVPMGQVHSQTVVLPDIVCGTYKVSGEAYYTSEGQTQVFSDNVKVSIPCKDFKGKLVAGLVARLPYPVLKFFAGLLGVNFG